MIKIEILEPIEKFLQKIVKSIKPIKTLEL